MEKLLKQRVEILAQELDKMKSGGAGEGYTKAEADDKFLSKDDASTALAGKQDSLDQTQLEAVNSGIDSAKVAQIETNKTNIWSVQNKVGKNKFNFDAWKNVPINKGTATIGTNSITLTATENDCFTKYGSEFPLGAKIAVTPGETLTLSWNYAQAQGHSQTDDNVFIFTYDSSGTGAGYVSEIASVGKKDITIPNNAITLDFRVGVSVAGDSATYSNIMICDKAIYDQDSTFQPYGAPNYDLTRLEAEDRAALAEKIDSGAKNVLSWSLEEAKRINTDGTWSGNVYTHNGIGYTVNSDMTVNLSMVSGTTTHPHSIFKLSESVSNSYTDSYVLSSGNTYMSDSSFALYAEETDSPWTDIAIDYGTGTIISSTAQSVYSVYISVKADYVLSTTQTVKPMICTEADWNVSQAYQPYRPSYQELYEMVLALQTTRTATTRKTTKTKTNEE